MEGMEIHIEKRIEGTEKQIAGGIERQIAGGI
jgi:hypothetical protein